MNEVKKEKSNSIQNLIESTETSVTSLVSRLLEGFSKCSTQVNLPTEDFKELWEKIDEKDLYTDPDSDRSFGIEDEPHVTVLYGLTKDEPKKMAEKLKDFGSIKLKLSKMSLFENEDYDVLKFDVESEDLHKLNNYIRKHFDYETDFPDYHPHATVAYLKKGKGKQYVDNRSNKFKDVVFEYDSILFSSKGSKKTVIPLK